MFQSTPELQEIQNEIVCGICLCSDLEDDSLGLPQPICGNPQCETYYHRDCLYKVICTAYSIP